MISMKMVYKKKSEMEKQYGISFLGMGASPCNVY